MSNMTSEQVQGILNNRIGVELSAWHGEYIIAQGNFVESTIDILECAIKSLKELNDNIETIEEFKVIYNKKNEPLARHDTVGYKFKIKLKEKKNE